MPPPTLSIQNEVLNRRHDDIDYPSEMKSFVSEDEEEVAEDASAQTGIFRRVPQLSVSENNNCIDMAERNSNSLTL